MPESHRSHARFAPVGDDEVRNHLVVSGESEDVAVFTKVTHRDTPTGAEFALGSVWLPIGFQMQRYRACDGEWITAVAGDALESNGDHEEHAETAYGFTTNAPVERHVADASHRHPELVFRYACLRKQGRVSDVARGGIWRAGRRIVDYEHRLSSASTDEGEMRSLIREVDALDAAARAPSPPV